MQNLFESEPDLKPESEEIIPPKKAVKRNKVKNEFLEPESFESAIARLEEALRILESGQVSLDQSLVVYKEARFLAEWCYSKLASVQGELKKLGLDEDGNFILEEFPPLE